MVVVDVPFREALENLLQRHAPFEACQRGTDAHVDAMPKTEMGARLAMNVETIAVDEAPVVAVGGTDEQHHDAARGNCLAANLGVSQKIPPDGGARRLEANQLLDRLWNQRGVVDEVSTLIGMLINFLRINPIAALFWTAVINGFLTPPILIVIMLVSNNRKVMGDRVNCGWANALGWVTTAAMSAAIALILTWGQG